MPPPDHPSSSGPDEGESEAGSLERTEFPCEICGAPTVWDPEADALACEHCGGRRAVPRAREEILERPLEDAGTSARGLGLETRALHCDTCGATVLLDEVATAETCTFCGSSNVLAQEARRNALRPESLVPLDVGRAAAEAGFRSWLGRGWFRPAALKSLRRFDATGVYVPYWTFDAQVRSRWSADAGHFYWTTQVVPVVHRGKLRMRTRRVRRVRWVPAWGTREDGYDDLLVNASRGVPDALAARLGPFDTAALVPYRPEYLAGWRAEEYQLDLEGGWQRGRAAIVAEQERRCARDVPGDTQRALQVSNALRGVRWKHVLLPLWTVSYRHGGKRYTVLIHGQSGRIHGEKPISWVKIVLFALALFALGATLLGLLAPAGMVGWIAT